MSRGYPLPVLRAVTGRIAHILSLNPVPLIHTKPVGRSFLRRRVPCRRRFYSASATRRRLRSHDLTTEGINVRAEERRAGQFRIVRPAPDAHALRPETDGDGLPRSAGGRLDVHIVRVRRGNCADDRTKTVVAVDVRPTIAESILGADGDETAIAAGENWTVRVGNILHAVQPDLDEVTIFSSSLRHRSTILASGSHKTCIVPKRAIETHIQSQV
jgi:hypothetical protein